jgi:hypothetical protein
MGSTLAKFCHRRAAPLLLLLSLGLCGCGEGRGRVSGAVTKNGQVVKSGVITFVNKDGKGTALAPIKKDGTYTALNVPSGETTVILVNAMEERDFGAIDMARVTKPARKPVASKMPTVIPDKFRKPETSGLAITVRSGNNPFDIDVGR